MRGPTDGKTDVQPKNITPLVMAIASIDVEKDQYAQSVQFKCIS